MPEEKLTQPKPPAEEPAGTVKLLSEERARRLLRGELTLGEYFGLPQQTLYKIATVGHQMLKTGKFDTALQIFEGLVAAAPYDSVFHVHRGAALANLERYDEAMDAYNQAIRFNIANVDALASRGELYLRKQQAGPAIADLEAAVKADAEGKHPAGQRARALLALLQRGAQGASPDANKAAPAKQAPPPVKTASSAPPPTKPAKAAAAPAPAAAKAKAEEKPPAVGTERPQTAEKRASRPADDSFGADPRAGSRDAFGGGQPRGKGAKK